MSENNQFKEIAEKIVIILLIEELADMGFELLFCDRVEPLWIGFNKEVLTNLIFHGLLLEWYDAILHEHTDQHGWVLSDLKIQSKISKPL